MNQDKFSFFIYTAEKRFIHLTMKIAVTLTYVINDFFWFRVYTKEWRLRYSFLK